MEGMKNFNGKLAVVTGGGTGMGRELVRQLIAERASVAMCDVLTDTMAETKSICERDGLPPDVRLTAHKADVSKEEDVVRFAREVAESHATDRIHLLFNNAGIAGGGSFVNSPREEWEKTFNVCWYGVYYSCRAFFPMLQKAERAHIVNTSSVNGFFASLGPGVPHTAYPAAKFAVKGFTEALIIDLRLNAPHITCSVVMPGHVGTSIVSNSRRVLDGGADTPSETQIQAMQKRLTQPGQEPMTREQVLAVMEDAARAFRENAPLTAEGAARIILDGVKANQWRILVGEDAVRLDEAVRADPWSVYDADYVPPFAATLPGNGSAD